MTTRTIPEVASTEDLENTDLMAWFRPGEDAPFTKTYQQMLNEYAALDGQDGQDGTDGKDGIPGSYERTIFRAAAAAPPTPTTPNSVVGGANPTLPTGWSATPPTGVTAIWASFQRVARGTTTVTYTAPRRWDGEDGVAGSARGTKIATITVPTQTNAQLNNAIRGVTIALESGVPSYVTATSSNPSTLEFAIGIPADNVIGVWFVSQLNGVEVDQIMHPWNSHLTAEREGLRISATSRIVVREQEVTTNGYPNRYSIEGGGTAVPANVTVEVFFAIAGGGTSDGGGGGDISQAEFDREEELRAAGDDYNREVISGTDQATVNAAFVTFLEAQGKSDNTGILEVATNSVSASGSSYVRGDIVIYSPKSTTGKLVGNLYVYASRGLGFLFNEVSSDAQLNSLADAQRDDPHGEFLRVSSNFRFTAGGFNFKEDDILWMPPYMPLRAGVHRLFNIGGKKYARGTPAINPKNIASNTALDGNYTISVVGEDLEWLQEQNVNAVAIEIGSGRTTVHTVSPWTPASNFEVEFNISNGEELSVGLSAAAKLLPVHIVYRHVESGSSFPRGGISTFISVGDGGGGGSSTPPDGSIGREQLDTELQGELAVIINNQDKLDQLEGALPFQTMQLSPASLRDDNMVSSVSLLLHNQLTKKTISSVALRIAGLPGTLDAATPLTNILQENGILRYTFTEGQIDTIGNSITSDVEKLTADVTITYSDTTTSVTRLAFGVQDPNAPGAAVVGPRDDNVLQAAVNGADTSGSTSITLPTNYATYKHLDIAVWEEDTDFIVEMEFSMAVLAAQTATRTFILAGLMHNNQNGRTVRVTWNPTSRVITALQNDRIIYAAMEDT